MTISTALDPDGNSLVTQAGGTRPGTGIGGRDRGAVRGAHRRVPVDDADLDGEQRARRLLAHLLEFHRREDKSIWWEFFHRCGFTEEEHVESRATLGALTYDGEVEQVKRSVVHRYRFPEQPHKIEVRDSPKNPDTAESDELKRGFCGTVVALAARGRSRHPRIDAAGRMFYTGGHGDGYDS